MPRTFAPAPHEIGARVEWTHLLADGRTLQRSGTVVGLAPALGAGHSRERWVVADQPLPSDLYAGGLVVAVARGRRAPVPAGQAFSEDSPSSPTGGLAVTNSRLSRQSRAA